MTRAVPPLPQIRSFVAVVAHGRLNRAAAALNLTESAVSHHLSRLEEALGVRLVERGRATTRPTPAGERFHGHAREALRLLEEAVAEATGGAAGRLSLTLPRALATHWLIPRFPRLYARHDELELQLLPTTRICDLAREQIDLGLRLGRGQWSGLTARPLLLERTCPVAAPELARQWRDAGWAAMSGQARLILNTTHPDEWARWCDGTGRGWPADARVTRLDSFDLVLQAALAGAGLVMGRTPMINDALARGDLVPPFPDWAVSDSRYFVVWPGKRPPNRHARIVIEWLAECAAETREDLSATATPP